MKCGRLSDNLPAHHLVTSNVFLSDVAQIQGFRFSSCLSDTGIRLTSVNDTVPLCKRRCHLCVHSVHTKAVAAEILLA
jgi:hypothetical protein